MNSNTMIVAALVILPAVGLLTWVWVAMARVEEELKSFIGFDGMHFDS